MMIDQFKSGLTEQIIINIVVNLKNQFNNLI